MKPKNIIQENKRFQAETPQLNFELEDKYKANFHIHSSEEVDALDADFIESERNNFNNAIDFLKIDAEAIPELSYLVDFLQEFQKAELAGEGEFNIEVDLNKLKYCKTLICYINEDYSERILSILDFLQDQLVDYRGVDENRVFFSPLKGYCQVRSDIQRNKEGVPVGDEYYTGKAPLQYRWRDEDFFEVLYKGQWVTAETIDFEFPFEHLRKN